MDQLKTCLGVKLGDLKDWQCKMSFVRRRALYKRKTLDAFNRTLSGEGLNLDSETIFSQTLKTTSTDCADSMDDIVNDYAEKVVNDSDHMFQVGPVFYKGSIICERPAGKYTIHFYLYTKTIWSESINDQLRRTYLKDLLRQSSNLSLKSERVLEPWRCVYRGSLHDCSSDNELVKVNKTVEEMEKTMITTFLNEDKLSRWTFMDILKDMYMFEVSHVTFLARWAHFVATPINIILSMMFLSQFYLIGGRQDSIINLNVSHLLVFILVGSYMRLGTIRRCELWGFTVAIVLLCLSLTGRSLYIRVCGYNSCPEGIYFLPLVFGFFTSLIQISSDFLYTDSSTGDITLEMLRDICYGFTFDTSLTLDDQLRQVVWFFAWTVPSTFVSWVQQIGVQVAFVLTNIGYRPPDAETFVKYLNRCEQNGLDVYHRLPKTSCDILRMTMTSPCVQALKECGLFRKRESLTTRETLNLCVTIRLCSIYLRKK